MYDNSEYAYIVGRLRALDTKMMNRSFLERLVDAKNADESYRVLNDMPLVSGSIKDYEVNDFNKVLQDALGELKELFIQMAPYKDVLNFLWYKYDFHNLKIVLKAKFTEKGYADAEHALVSLGSISFEDWERYLIEDENIQLTDGLGDIISKAKEAYEKSGDPQIIDQIIDGYYLLVLKSISDKMDSALISSYLRRLIDISNLKAFVRATELKKKKSYLEGVLLEGGYVSSDTFITSFERNYDDLRQVLEKKMHADDLVLALESFTEEKSLLATEKKAHELQEQFMNESGKIVFGPEPVFAFFWKFENHLQIIRTVLVGKLNNLPAEEISKYVLSI